jgi:ribonuclease P protein component
MPSISQQLSTFTRQEVDNFFKSAHATKKTRAFTCLMAPRTKAFARILVIASGKSGSAVERNRIRRRIKALFLENKLFDYPNDCVIIVKQTAGLAELQDIKNLILHIESCQSKK